MTRNVARAPRSKALTRRRLELQRSPLLGHTPSRAVSHDARLRACACWLDSSDTAAPSPLHLRWTSCRVQLLTLPPSPALRTRYMNLRASPWSRRFEALLQQCKIAPRGRRMQTWFDINAQRRGMRHVVAGRAPTRDAKVASCVMLSLSVQALLSVTERVSTEG